MAFKSEEDPIIEAVREKLLERSEVGLHKYGIADYGKRI